MAVLGVANARLEAALKDAIDNGVGAATIFASCYLENDPGENHGPKLTARLSAMAKEAGVAICGGNCMGFYNLDYGLRICGFPPPDWMRAGASPSSPIRARRSRRSATTTSAWASTSQSPPGRSSRPTSPTTWISCLSMESTKVVGLFLETVRDPEGFARGLEKARAQNVPSSR